MSEGPQTTDSHDVSPPAHPALHPGMTLRGRVILNVCLTLAMVATLYAVALPASWLKHKLNAPPARATVSQLLGGVMEFSDPRMPSSIPALIRALKKTCHIVIWVVPLCFFPKLRDIGSFRFPWTWTILLGVPAIVANLRLFNRLFFFEFISSEAWIPGSLPVILVYNGLATGVFEELVFRGYAFRNRPQTHARLAIVISAVCFALMHLVNFTHDPSAKVFAHLPSVFAMGLGFGIIRIVSGSLAWCMLLHGLMDAISNLLVHPGSHWSYFDWLTCTMGITSIATLCLHPKLRHRTPAQAQPSDSSGAARQASP